VASDEGQDPIIRLILDLLERAKATEPADPTAAALATADTAGCPSVRMVLVKGVDGDAFLFFTNYGSRKARDLEVNPRAPL
jgi:pyridoxamine 5'-phosphate oxidase